MDAPTTTRTIAPDRSAIAGWGVDADPENDPTYPYREREKDDHSGEWVRPPVQRTEVEILQSIEHKRRPAVFGTSTPPSGLSGMLRRGAFKYSESHWAHWLMLMGADRVNMVEGIVQDLARAKIPNIPAEMGMRSEWQHNRKGLVTKLAITAALGAAAVALLSRSRSRREPD
jgi:uncharacterized lipoprotein YddW (UPF0748 family)